MHVLQHSGAAILQEFYKKDATPVAGAAFLLLEEQQRNTMCFASLEQGKFGAQLLHSMQWCSAMAT